MLESKNQLRPFNPSSLVSAPPASRYCQRVVTLDDFTENLALPPLTSENTLRFTGNAGSVFRFVTDSLITGINLTAGLYNPGVDLVGVHVAFVDRSNLVRTLFASQDVLLSLSCTCLLPDMAAVNPQTTQQTIAIGFEQSNGILALSGREIAIQFTDGSALGAVLWGVAQVYYQPISLIDPVGR